MNLKSATVVIALLLNSFVSAQTTAPATAPATAPSTEQSGPVIGQCMVMEPLGRGGRTVTVVDPIEAALVAGTWQPPKVDEAVTGFDGREHKWRVIEAKENTYADEALQGGWAYLPIESPDERIVMLAASGQALAYVNGEPRGGDVYELGFVRLPILLRAGTNHLLFVCARGRLRVEIAKPRSGLMVETADATLPDFLSGTSDKQPVGALVVNATTQPITPAIGGNRGERQTIPPLSVRKIRSTVEYRGQEGSKFDSLFTVASETDATMADSQSFSYRVLAPGSAYKRTFISDIDDSVQYFAVLPQIKPTSTTPAEKPALILSLHGASVEATSQAGAYAPKSWAHIVCPTNRRPYGFDWEDWGRLDAMEVLRIAQTTCDTDPTRVYLTGHSMGGHGVWQLGSLYPDRFAAIGVSAGWLSFASYRSAPPTTESSTAPASAPSTQPTSTTEIFRRAGNSSDTQSFMSNLARDGVYILHGIDDDNVPFAQAQQALKILETFHYDFQMHAQPKAGHWWDASDEPGTDCVDWAPMFDMFARHRLPKSDEIRDIDFRTVNPAISSRDSWVAIDAQIRPLSISRVQMRCDPHSARFVGTTENVARLWIDLRRLPASETAPTVKIDDQIIKLDRDTDAWLYRDGDTWNSGPAPTPAMKNASRSGPFKLAFNNHMVFVYGTLGTAEENAAAFNKARYDAETWWYRGNGAVDVVPDTDASWRQGDRNVILYGNADTNGAWATLLNDSPIQVNRGKVKIGDREETGDGLAAMFLRPHPTSPTALVAAIAGTGPTGMRLTNRIPIFVSGAGLPDWFVIDAAAINRGTRAARGAGYFDNHWKLSPADTAWNPATP
ncbi:MAG: prolyl oligopeptidase family serine peptidase [Anaerolineae bacterium]|nr:prolyl oligopeptidase family serine peptidase [Phycisphaerae bacterium]